MQALVFSSGHSQTEFVKLLLAHGANPDVADEQGATARAAAYARPDLSALIAAAKPPTKDQLPPPGGAQQLLNIQMVLVIKLTCDANLPGFKQESADAYRRWREPRETWVEAFEKSPKYQMVLEQTKPRDPAAVKAPSPAQQASAAKELESTCRGDLLDEFAKGSGSAAIDPELATPEKTWNHYLASLRQGDRRAAIDCLTSTARDKFRPVLQQFTPEQMRGMADAVQSFTLTGTKFGNMAEAAVAMKSGAGGLVYFVNMNGEWRINEM
jgi:hypothetical protein